MMLPPFMNPRPHADTITGRALKPGADIAFLEKAYMQATLPRIPFPLVKQELTNWCWAAVASGVDKVRGAARSQCAIAGIYGQYTTDPSTRAALAPPICPPPSRANVTALFNKVLDCLQLSGSHPFREIEEGDATGDEARAYLATGLPVPIRIRWSADTGHIIALIGTESAAPDANFLVYDPLKENLGYMLTVSELELSTSYQGKGWWSHIYPVR